MKFPILTILAFSMLFSSYAPAQSYRSTVNEGNEYYGKKEYDKASELYDRAATANPERMESYFNRGNAAYRNNDIKTALDSYEKAGKRVRSARDLANTMYNAGNTFLNAAEQGAENPVLQQKAGGDAQQLRMEGYRQAIGMYKRALKINPDDSDARYNLTYARKKLDELQQQQNKENQDQDKKQKQDQEKNQDKDKQDKDKQDQKDKQDKQDEQQQKKQNQKDQENKEKAKPNEQEKSQPERKHNMSKQQAERILNALEQDEKDLQKKKRQQVNARVQVEKDW